MKSFEILSDTWLPVPAFEKLSQIYVEHWNSLESLSGNNDQFKFVKDQNEGLLLRLFFEQAFKANPIEDTMAKIIERDFEDALKFERAWKTLANDQRISWLVLGLSFTDFRFHLFPIAKEFGIIPFSLSPIMSNCFREDAIRLSGYSRFDYSNRQWACIDWKIVEQRISCLSEPLDIFGEMGDCADDNCKTF